MSTNTERKFSFSTNTLAWDFMRAVSAERVGQAGFPSLDSAHSVRVIPAYPAQVDLIAQELGGTEIA